MDPLIPLIGLGLTTATSIGASIFNAAREEPDIPGASGAQKLGLALTQGRANQLASGQGLSETEYNRPLEAAQRQVAGASAQGMEQTRSASPFMSNVAAERIAHEFASKGGEILTETRKELTSMDIRAARENLKLSLQAQQMANQQANEIAEIERRKKAQEEAWRNQKLMGIVSAAGSAATSMMKLVEMGEAIKPTPDVTTTASGPLDTMSAAPIIRTTDPTPALQGPMDQFLNKDLSRDTNFGLSLFGPTQAQQMIPNLGQADMYADIMAGLD